MPDYDAKYYDFNQQSGDRPALWFYSRLVRRLLGTGPVLDFGCGTGFLLRRLMPYFQVSGFELSEYCRVELKKNLPQVPIFGDLSELPESKFTGIVSLHVFEHISDAVLVGVLKNLHRSLVSGGRMLCVMPDAGGLGRQLKGDGWSGFRDPTHINLKSAFEWETIFADNGFQAVMTGADGLWDFPYSVGCPVMLDKLRRAWSTLFQFLAGRLILSAGRGESVIFLLNKV